MEPSILTSQHFAIFLPVGLVIVFAILVFAFGFRSSVEPPSFKHISSTADEKKTVKKKKVKDKKPQTNGHATVVIDVPDTKKSDGVTKIGKQSNKVETPKAKKVTDGEKPAEKKSEPQKSPAKKERKSEGKNKKDIVEKPADFDEGEWETAPSRKDKKKKKDDDIIAALTPEKAIKKKSPIAKKEKNEEEVAKIETKLEETAKPSGDALPSDESPTVATAVAPIPAAIAVETAIVPTAPPPVVAPEPPAVVKLPEVEPTDEQAGRKKKGKKGKSNLAEEDAVVPEVEESPISPSTEVAESPQAFNELEDSWKDAPQRKSKKKVRKD